MDLRTSDGSESRFSAFVEGLVSVIGHADRARPLFDYCIGLIMPGERKSVEPMAAVTAPDRTAAQHQSLLHFVGQSPWSDEGVLAKVGEMVLPAIERHGPIEAWIIDDTGFPKKGAHSVGVARQYCGQLGKQDNCQVAVSLSLANHHASLPTMYRLYLPQEWAADKKRRRKVGVPKEISFKTKPEIALEQIEAACRAGLPRGVVLMDAGYGCNTDLRTSISALGLTYVAGVLPNTTVWTSDTAPLPPKKWSGKGRPPKWLRRDHKHQPTSVKELALGLPKRAWRTIKWREGAAERLSSRFARARVCVAHRDYQLTESRPEEWLLIEWPEGENEPTKYWLSTLPKDHFRKASRSNQAALAHRARLSGSQTRGRARAFRRARLAWLPPPRHAVHRGLRIPGLREGDDSPLGIWFLQAVQETYDSQRLPTQGLCRCGPNVTSQTRLRRCGED
jgi:SRSO17 transposase